MERTHHSMHDFPSEDFRVIHEAMIEFAHELTSWNKRALEKGARTAPYADTADRIQSMVDYGINRLVAGGEGSYRVDLGMVSEESISIWVAVLRYKSHRLRAELQDLAAQGWPSAVLGALEERLSKTEELAGRFQLPPAEILHELLPQERPAAPPNEWDVFISHASEDKADVARPLASGLRNLGLRVWYDDFTLTIGDSLRRSIDHGLRLSRFGVVILSPRFFAKEWPQKELDGLYAMESSEDRIILPVWHEVDAESVARFSPTLADRVGLSTEFGLAGIAGEIAAKVRRVEEREAAQVPGVTSLPQPSDPPKDSVERARTGVERAMRSRTGAPRRAPQAEWVNQQGEELTIRLVNRDDKPMTGWSTEVVDLAFWSGTAYQRDSKLKNVYVTGSATVEPYRLGETKVTLVMHKGHKFQLHSGRSPSSEVSSQTEGTWRVTLQMAADGTEVVKQNLHFSWVRDRRLPFRVEEDPTRRRA